MTNSYINPTQPTTGEPRYSQDAPAWQDVEIVDVPAVEEPEPAEGAPEPIRIIDEPEPGEATAGDAVIEYTRDHLPVNMGVDTDHSDFTREQAEQLVGDIQEQLYETAKSQKRLHDLIAQAYDQTEVRVCNSRDEEPAMPGQVHRRRRPHDRPATHQPHPQLPRRPDQQRGPRRGARSER